MKDLHITIALTPSTDTRPPGTRIRCKDIDFLLLCIGKELEAALRKADVRSFLVIRD